MKRLFATGLLVVTLLGLGGQAASADTTNSPPPPVQTSTWE
jgi:hypothetical protein